MFCFERTLKYRVTGNCVTRAICHCYLFILSRFRFLVIFLNATTNLLNRSVIFVSISDVDSVFSVRLEDSEAEVENDE